MISWSEPSVSVIIATRGRGELLRRAVRSIIAQEYGGPIEIVVVYDQTEIDALDDVRADGTGAVHLRTIANARTPGLAGGRNTGIGAATGDWIAFCDDDDEWTPGKLRAQARLWAEHPEAVGMSSGVEIVTQSGSVVRVPPLVTTRADFLESRVSDIHPSSFLFRRADLLGLPGGVDEEIPSSYGEDYDLLLRITDHGPIVSVQEPVVVVHWDRDSYFAGRWLPMAEGLSFLLGKHTDLLKDDGNAARMCGQVAFAFAAGGDRREARAWARRAQGHRFVEPRALLTWIVLTGVMTPKTVVAILNKRGKGI